MISYVFTENTPRPLLDKNNEKLCARDKYMKSHKNTKERFLEDVNRDLCYSVDLLITQVGTVNVVEDKISFHVE